MPTVIPFILNHPRITLNKDTTPVELDCSANEVHTNVSQDENTTETFCGTFTTYKPEVWDITLNGVQSFDADGLWTVLRPLVGQTVPFELLPDGDQPNSATNPLMFGVATVKAFPFIDGAIGEASEFDVVLAVQGAPSFAPPDTAPVLMGSSEESTSSSEAPAEAAA